MTLSLCDLYLSHLPLAVAPASGSVQCTLPNGLQFYHNWDQQTPGIFLLGGGAEQHQYIHLQDEMLYICSIKSRGRI